MSNLTQNKFGSRSHRLTRWERTSLGKSTGTPRCQMRQSRSSTESTAWFRRRDFDRFRLVLKHKREKMPRYRSRRGRSIGPATGTCPRERIALPKAQEFLPKTLIRKIFLRGGYRLVR